MAYDQSKDKVVKAFGDIQVGEKVFAIGIFQYNGGDKKLGIQKKFTKQNGSVTYGSMGRLTRDEAVAIHEALAVALADSSTDW